MKVMTNDAKIKVELNTGDLVEVTVDDGKSTYMTIVQYVETQQSGGASRYVLARLDGLGIIMHKIDTTDKVRTKSKALEGYSPNMLATNLANSLTITDFTVYPANQFNLKLMPVPW